MKTMQTVWTLGLSAMFVATVACSGGISPVNGSSSGGDGGDSDGGVGPGCTKEAIDVSRACVPGTAKAGVELTLDADGVGCGGCGTTIGPCVVNVTGDVIRLSMDVQKCPLPEGVGCDLSCALPEAKCVVPALAEGTYRIELAKTNGSGSSADRVRVLVVKNDGAATSCAIPRTDSAPPSVDIDSFPKACAIDSDCVAAVDGEVCNPCTCPNGVIAKSASDDYQGKVREQQALCTGPAGGGACAPCPDRTPKCNAGQCVLTTP